MGGFFGVVSRESCSLDLLYGTDYHSHLGTRRGGITLLDEDGYHRDIHNITQKGFRAQLEEHAVTFSGQIGIGVISDYEDQPISSSRFGGIYVVQVGRVNNLTEIVEEFDRRNVSFSEPAPDKTMIVNPTEAISHLIGLGNTIEDGIEIMQNRIDGSSSVLVMTRDSIYAARDKYGRTPVIIAKKDGAYAVTMETTALFNQGFKPYNYEDGVVNGELGPGEIVRISVDGVERLKKPGDIMQICAFLWIYYGFPASSYEGVNVEVMRNTSGEFLARGDMKRTGKGPGELPFDIITGIPDSGIGSAIGYVNASKMREGRPFVKYTPSWPRSFMPQEQRYRDLVARKKQIPIEQLIRGFRILSTEDSVVRATQLNGFIRMIIEEYGAREVHMRPACPPLTQGCKNLNFSRSSSVNELAARRAIVKINKEDGTNHDVNDFNDENGELYHRMVGKIGKDLSLTSLHYQKMDDLIASIGLPREKLCLGCWRETNCTGCK